LDTQCPNACQSPLVTFRPCGTSVIQGSQQHLTRFPSLQNMSTSQPVKSDARAAAEARRQKILASRGDRLAKLTNTARGAEGGAVFDNEAPLAAFSSSGMHADFLGEGEPLPSLPADTRIASRRTRAPPNLQGHGAAQTPALDPAFLTALSNPMNGPADNGSMPNDPFLAMMQAMTSGNMPGPATQQTDPPQTAAQLSRTLPLVHALSILCTLLYCAVILEPRVWKDSAGLLQRDLSGTVWERWKPLVSGRHTAIDLQRAPVFYIFLALQLGLHSLRFVLDRNVRPPPGLLSSILPYLPPRFQLYLTGGRKYIAIGQQFLDDLGLMIFLLGVIIWYANL